MKIGYAAYKKDFSAPGDRRRFCAYAASRQIEYEFADPEKEYDLVIVSEMADITKWSNYPHGIVIYDLIDSYLAIPRSDMKQRLRGILGFVKGRYSRLKVNYRDAVEDMCRRADAVVCSTEEQRHDILKYCSRVAIILDSHEEVSAIRKREYASNDPIQLVWEGLPSNINQLSIIAEVLEELNLETAVLLNVITDERQVRYFRLLGNRDVRAEVSKMSRFFRFHKFDIHTWSSIVTNCDVAVIPIDLKDPFTRGKPENKLLIFWRVAVPVVTGATPAYIRAQRLAGMEPKYACKNKAEWVFALKSLLQDEATRRNIAESGLACAERDYSADSIFSKWDDLFYQLGVKF